MSAIQEAVELWNEVAAVCGWPVVRGLTSQRERGLRRVLRSGIGDWKEALAKAQQSDFLCGKTEKSERYQNYRFNIDTMLREGFFLRLLEGVYDNREQQVTFKSPETILWEARMRGYAPDKLWPFMWGPRPGEDGCQAPKKLVEEWKQRHEGAH